MCHSAGVAARCENTAGALCGGRWAPSSWRGGSGSGPGRQWPPSSATAASGTSRPPFAPRGRLPTASCRPRQAPASASSGTAPTWATMPHRRRGSEDCDRRRGGASCGGPERVHFRVSLFFTGAVGNIERYGGALGMEHRSFTSTKGSRKPWSLELGTSTRGRRLRY